MSGTTSRVTSRATSRGTRTRGGGEVVDNEPGVVDDERRDELRDEPRGVPRHLDARRRRSSRRQAMSRVMCRGTQTRGVGEVVDDEPRVVDDERRNEPRDEPRGVPRHPDAQRR
jgi:hypothetical protein